VINLFGTLDSLGSLVYNTELLTLEFLLYLSHVNIYNFYDKISFICIVETTSSKIYFHNLKCRPPDRIQAQLTLSAFLDREESTGNFAIVFYSLGTQFSTIVFFVSLKPLFFVPEEVAMNLFASLDSLIFLKLFFEEYRNLLYFNKSRKYMGVQTTIYMTTIYVGKDDLR
ncbi:hypothetical protein ACJX0J_031641, partial [Zea mays]